MFSCVKVISKFYEIRHRAMGGFVHENLDEICSCLLNDPPEIWNLDEGRNTSTLKYIASLESKLDSLRKSMGNFQNKLRMGLEIEQHLKRRVQILEKQIRVSTDIIRTGISGLHNFHNELRFNIARMLKEESDRIELDFAEIKEKMAKLSETIESKTEAYRKDRGIVEECKDLHVSSIENVKPCVVNTTDNLSDTSDALALALNEKVDALLLLSQQEERHLLERETNISLQIKMNELQKNFFQVTHEKVKALMELADLKKQFQLQQENCKCGMKQGYVSADGGSKLLPSPSRDGRLKGILKKTYLRRWIGYDMAANESSFQSDQSFYVSDNSKKNAFAGVSRDTENITSEETMNITAEVTPTDVERIAASVHKLHLELVEIKDNALSSSANIRSVADAVAAIILDANQVRTSLDGLLHVSQSIEGAEAWGANNPREESNDMLFGKRASYVVLEMIELLFLAAKMQEQIIEKIEDAYLFVRPQDTG